MASIRKDLLYQGTGRLDVESVPICQVKYTIYQSTLGDSVPEFQRFIAIRKNDPFKNEFIRTIGKGSQLTLLVERPLEDGKESIPIKVVQATGHLSDEEFVVYEIKGIPFHTL